MKRIYLISLSLGVLLLSLSTLWSQGYVFGPNIRVNDDPPGTAFHGTPNAGQRGVAVRGDTVYCLWRDDRTGSGIWFAKSVDGGETFLANVQVDDGYGFSILPTLVVGNDGTIYTAWQDRRPPFSFWQIYFSKSTDGGLTFTPDVLVNDTAGGIKNRPHRSPSMDVDSAGTIYIAFDDARINDYDIYFSKSTDEGLTFTPDVLVNDTMPSDTFFDNDPALCVSKSGDIYVSWDKDSKWVFTSKSTDGGASFGPDILVNDTITESWAQSMDIDDRGYIHVAWRDWRDGNYNVYYARSTDGGTTFSPNIRLNGSAGEPLPQSYPSLCANDSGIVFAVWEHGWATEPDIYFTYSADNGDSVFVEPNVLIDDTDSACYYPSIAVGDSDKVYVLWTDFRYDGPDAYFSVGKFESGISEEREKNGDQDFHIFPPFPNPFSKTTQFAYVVDKSNVVVKLNIYDVSGKCVRALVNTIKEPGSHHELWNGTDENNVKVPSGVYFLRGKIGAHKIIQKLILLRGQSSKGEVKRNVQ